MFGRATITLGIGPHSSSIFIAGHVRTCPDRPIFALKVAFSRAGIWTPSKTLFLVHVPNGNTIGIQPLFAGLTVVTDRQTDRQCYSVCSDRPRQVATATMRPNTPFTRYNRFDNRLYRVNKHPTGSQTGLYNRFDNRLYTRMNVRIHAIQPVVKCQTGLTTGLTTCCIV